MKRAYCTIMLAGTLSFGFSAAVCTASGIHKLVDERGHVVFTNNPAKNTRQIPSSKSVPVTPSRRNSAGTEPITIAITGNYPRVSKLQQDQRDGKRRQILAQELANETRLLEDTLKTIDLTQQKTNNYLSGSHPYFTPDHFDILQLRNQAAAHERNIEALKIELNNL